MLGIVVGGYHLLNEIGSGGFGTVYRAYHPLNRRAVALKRLNHTSADIERFRREGRVLAQIDHPNVITLLDSGDDWMALELMQFSLREVMASSGRLSISRSVDICRQVALGLRAVHEQNVIHRDIKPANILIDSNGVIKVSDFGIARAEDLTTLTSPGRKPPFTKAYASPEQRRGWHVDIRTDIYSLGATLYEMLLGWTHRSPDQPPFSYSDTLRVLRESVPTALRRIVDTCLADHPEDRYQSMDDLLQEITDPALIDRCALIDFFMAMGGPNWERKDNWLTDAPLSEWYGCDPGSSGVWGLDLYSNGLEGRIPPEMGYLTGIHSLDLSYNPGIVGPFQTELWYLSKLETLDLSNTRISGTLPLPDPGRIVKDPLDTFDTFFDVGDYVSLSHLDLSNCRFTGDMPKWLPVKIGRFGATVSLSGNNWTGTHRGVTYWSNIKDSDKIPLPY